MYDVSEKEADPIAAFRSARAASEERYRQYAARKAASAEHYRQFEEAWEAAAARGDHDEVIRLVCAYINPAGKAAQELAARKG